jgi:hypothetical protein
MGIPSLLKVPFSTEADINLEVLQIIPEHLQPFHSFSHSHIIIIHHEVPRSIINTSAL